MKKTRFFSKIDPPRGASKYTVIRAGKPVKRYGRRMTKGRFLTSGRGFWGPDPPQMADVRFLPKNTKKTQKNANFFNFFHFFSLFYHSYNIVFFDELHVSLLQLHHKLS